MAKKVFIYHDIAAEFLKRELAIMPEHEANRIAAEILAFAANLLPNADWPGLIKDLLACSLMPNLYFSAPGRPSKENAPAPDLARLIADPAHLARVEAILQSGAIKKPANVAHLAQAIEELRWTNWQAAPPKDFFTIVAQQIGATAGTYNTYKSALNRARKIRAKANKNSTAFQEIESFINLLRADEI